MPSSLAIPYALASALFQLFLVLVLLATDWVDAALQQGDKWLTHHLGLRKQLRKKVVIVGGSFSGLHAARGLQREFDVIIIDPKEYVEYTPGILRAVVEPSHLPNLMAYFKADLQNSIYYKHVQFIQSKVQAVHPKSVTTSNGEVIPFDYLLLCIGKGYSKPFMPEEPTIKERSKAIQEAYHKLEEAKTVVVAGGGPVGIELCGEIVTTFPGKKVILIAGSKSRVLAQLPPSASEYAENFLKNEGVEIIYSDRMESHNGNTVKTRQGKTIEADLVYECMGFPSLKPDIDFGALKGMTFTESNSIIVNSSLQLPGYPNIFALGDIAQHESRDMKLGHTAELNAIVAIQNIKRMNRGNSLFSYPRGILGTKTVPKIMVVSLGKYDAVLRFNSWVLKGSLAAFAKWFVEWSKVLQERGSSLGQLVWDIGDNASMLMHKVFFDEATKLES